MMLLVTLSNMSVIQAYLELDRLAVYDQVGELTGDGVFLAPLLRLGARLCKGLIK